MYVARDASRLYRTVQRVLWFLFSALTRLHVQGIENVPSKGRVIISPNHLHALDIPLVGMAVRRRSTILAADKWKGKLGGWVMERITGVIFVARGAADRKALSQALVVLQRDEALAVAPEGTRSRGAGLQKGHEGAAYLAARTGAPIVPIAVWGHEKASSEWRRLRRPDINLCIGTPIRLPDGTERARSADLQAYTDEIMTAIARMMPPEYRGMYADNVGSHDASAV